MQCLYERIGHLRSCSGKRDSNRQNKGVLRHVSRLWGKGLSGWWHAQIKKQSPSELNQKGFVLDIGSIYRLTTLRV